MGAVRVWRLLLRDQRTGGSGCSCEEEEQTAFVRLPGGKMVGSDLWAVAYLGSRGTWGVRK